MEQKQQLNSAQNFNEAAKLLSCFGMILGIALIVIGIIYAAAVLQILIAAIGVVSGAFVLVMTSIFEYILKGISKRCEERIEYERGGIKV